MLTIRRNIVLTAAPATTTDSVKMAQVVPDVCPREPEFGDLLASVRRDLVRVAGGGEDYCCVLLTGSGTSAMDGAISSAVPPGGTLLVAENGAYGKRMTQIAAAYGIDCIRCGGDWCSPVDPTDVHEVLENRPEISTVAMVHHE